MPNIMERLSNSWRALLGHEDVPGEIKLKGGEMFFPRIQMNYGKERHGLAKNRRELLQTYRTVPWIRAIASRIGDAVSTVEWKLYRAVERNEMSIRYGQPTVRKDLMRAPVERRHGLISVAAANGELEEIHDHPFIDAWMDGNDYHTGATIRRLTQVYLDLCGESFMFKKTNKRGAVNELWLVPPSWVMETPSKAKPYFKILVNGLQEDVPEDDILWVNNCGPENPYGRGVGYSEALDDEVDTDEFAAKMTRQVFLNNARPDLVVTPIEGESLNETQTRDLENNWTQRTQGVFKILRPLFLRRKVEIKDLPHNFRNIQLKELREQGRNIICQVFAIPPECVAIIENSNRSTILSANDMLARYVVLPRVEFLRSQMQKKLIRHYGNSLILDYVSPVKADRDFQLDVMNKAPFAFRADEWRELADREPIGDKRGEAFMAPNYYMPTDFTGEMAQAQMVDTKSLTDEEILALEHANQIMTKARVQAKTQKP